MSDPSTAEARYDALFAAVFPLYQEGRYADALTRLDEDPGDLAEWSAMVTEIRACLLASPAGPTRRWPRYGLAWTRASGGTRTCSTATLTSPRFATWPATTRC